MNRWTPICTLDDLPRLGARRVTRAHGLPVALFRAHDDRVYALLDCCPHKGGPLSQGLVAGDRVTCPLHGWTIGLADGSAQAPDDGRTPTFSCRVAGGTVYLDADELETRAPETCAPAAAARGCGCACGGG